MGSDWDYINKHMGGHDENGIPNFVRVSGFSDDTDVKNSIDEEIDMKSEKYYYILENLIERIEMESLSLKSITNAELDTLKYLLSEIYSAEYYSEDGSNNIKSTYDFDNFDDDIPF